MTKKALSFILVLALALSFTTIASAETSTATSLDHANALKDLGLFMGTDKGFDLDRAPTRVESVVMLLRMLGEEKAALSSSHTNPFTDVPTWATKYISYAYNKGYTNGTSKTSFGSNDLATPEQFITFMLRALGYSDKAGDFIWSQSIAHAEWLEVIGKGKYQVGSKSFMRSDCVDIMFNFLTALKKNSSTTLAESLIKANVIDGTKAEKYGLYTPKTQYEIIKVPLRDNTIYMSDVIAKVPGAKYATVYHNNKLTPNNYKEAFEFGAYKDLSATSISSDLVSLYQNDYRRLEEKGYNIAICVFNEKATMVGAAAFEQAKALKDGYVEIALYTLTMEEIKAEFIKAFGSPAEVPSDIISHIEKAQLCAVYRDKISGEVISKNMVSGNYYRYVLNKTKYPELTAKIACFSDGDRVSGISFFENIMNENLGSVLTASFKGKLQFGHRIMDYKTYSSEWFSDWTQNALAWNNMRYGLFADGDSTPIAYTQFVPSQVKVVNIGVVEETYYK